MSELKFFVYTKLKYKNKINFMTKPSSFRNDLKIFLEIIKLILNILYKLYN